MLREFTEFNSVKYSGTTFGPETSFCEHNVVYHKLLLFIMVKIYFFKVKNKIQYFTK